jgi:lantibiotic modifying enzyme
MAARVGRLLAADDVVEGARALLGGLPADLAQPYEHDLLSGSAGGVLALLALQRLLDDDTLLGVAAELSDRLVAAAEPDGDGCSWPSIMQPDAPNLLGLSHGTAGIALALLELWQATGEARYRATAERAFAFERGWFNAAAGNWPDFRQVTWRDERPGGPFPFPAFWCHGAPGIALTRLRAWQLTGDATLRDEAIQALDTTEQAVRAALHDGTVNYSLCHGLCGNAEILMLGRQILGAEFEHFAGAAGEVAGSGVELFAPEDRAWPLGTHGGWTPGLMLGLAGIGRFYLRLAAPTLTPSVLLATPETWARDSVG